MQELATTAARGPLRRIAPLVAVLAVVLVAGLAGMPGIARGAAPSSRPAARAPYGAAGRNVPAIARRDSTERLRYSAASHRRALDAALKRAVVVVGPVGSSTKHYIERAEAVAEAAESWGMVVDRIYPPHATWEAVVAAANGAHLFAYLGHGNGWPSPYPPFQEDTKDGLGLNPTDGDRNNDHVKYVGANFIIDEIKLAPNAIVVLNGLCYADGNAEPGMPIPTVRVARQRVENYASGFLAAGARAVFALGWQPGEDVVDGLFGMHTTIDGLFMTEFREGSPDWLPYHGWIGWKPDLYFDSARTAGAMLHLDPDQDHGFLRSVTGDLAFTTDEWVTGVPVDPDDHEPPVLSGLSVGQPDDTLPAGDDALPVFTPNGDGVSDMVSVGLTLSEGAYLDVSVAKRDGTVVRHALAWAGAGTAAVSWDGRNDAGRLVKDGRFDITVAPRDAAGNEGDPGTVSVKVLTAMREPSVSPGLFFPLDADTIAQLTTSTVTLAAPATISWRMVDDSGDVVRTAFTDEPLDVGIATWDWDGLDDAGIAVRPGVYTSVVSATTANGTYSHRLAVRVMAFDVRGRLTIARSSKSVLRILSAEPLAGSPVVVVKQRGLDPYPLKVTAVGPDRYRARWTPRPGKAGRVTITIAATDAEGGTNTQVLVGQLR